MAKDCTQWRNAIGALCPNRLGLGIDRAHSEERLRRGKDHPLPVSSLILALCFLPPFPYSRACSQATLGTNRITK